MAFALGRRVSPASKQTFTTGLLCRHTGGRGGIHIQEIFGAPDIGQMHADTGTAAPPCSVAAGGAAHAFADTGFLSEIDDDGQEEGEEEEDNEEDQEPAPHPLAKRVKLEVGDIVPYLSCDVCKKSSKDACYEAWRARAPQPLTWHVRAKASDCINRACVCMCVSRSVRVA